jgi:alkanesulfonate monooxygenase SsuD/methylene tetrahydromethanopterin reductase-like flavin-dependent oxidoreductase (luciferase family)
VNLRSGRPSTLPPPRPGYLDTLGPSERALVDQILACSAVGAPETVRAKMQAFIDRTGADELMLASQTHDHAARVRSYGIVAGLRAGLHAPAR